MNKSEYAALLKKVDFNYNYYNGQLYKDKKDTYEKAVFYSKRNQDFENMFNDARSARS